MAKAKRVFQVAKGLGVDSKTIVAKCQAEGVPGITNHMSTVKIGLEVTINEWFPDSAGEQAHTAVEVANKVDLTANKVDLTKVRKTARRRPTAKRTTKPIGEAPQEPVVSDASTTTPQPAAPTPATPSPISVTEQPPTPASTTGKAKKLEPQPPVQPQPQTPAEPTQIQETAATSEDSSATGPIGKPNVPNRPSIVQPAGEQLQKPQQATLKGPKVIRIEQPDVLRPQRTPSPKPNASPKPPLDNGDVAGITRSHGPARGRGATEEKESGQTDKSNKRRSLTTRRGRSADAQLNGPSNYSEQDLIELDARLRGAPGFLKQRRRDMKKRESPTYTAPTPAEIGGSVEIDEPITIKELSACTGIKSSEVIKYLFDKGIMATINSAIETEAAMEIAMEYDIELVVREQQTAEQLVIEEFENREALELRRRPPMVTVLGHVDHGKTSLLDKIRSSDVAAHEAGGITQHVGAYRITIEGHDGQPRTVVFMDTPGHEAFTSMRARGATMTDLVVLVVAADDGVMPQTIESINHAKAAEVRIIVALNKSDLPQANDENIRKIQGQLAEHGLNPVEWGGDTEIIKTSAETGEGITDLLEMLDYQAELLDLKADFNGPARGVVIEAEMQEGRGPVSRILVQQGHLKVSDFIVVGRAFGRVRDMTDDRGQSLTEAGPATPLELSGIDLIPDAGDKFYVTDTLRRAEEVAMQYRDAERQRQLASKTKITLDNFSATLQAGNVKDLRVVLKADVQGSIDVLTNSLTKLGNTEVSVRVIHSGVGGINESDILLAEASDAIIIGFHVVASPHARELSDERGVDIRLYRVIYNVTNEITSALEGMLEPEIKEEILGTAEIREIFKIGKLGLIAGCLVANGLMKRGTKARVLRDDVIVTDDRSIESFRRVKDDVDEVRTGTECGIRVTGFDDLKPGDQIICYNVETVARKLAMEGSPSKQ